MSLTIEAEWERLDSGAPEERACFAALGICADGIWFTQAEDAFVKRLRDKVHLSAYRLAEWIGWNYWRLRWEPRKSDPDWALAHRLSTIGGGYVWPNVSIFSDGERVALLAKPTRPRPQEPLRYLADAAIVVPAREFEQAIDLFMEQVRGQLRAERLTSTNLHQIWDDVLAKRADPAQTILRKFEALLGFDPDEADEAVLEALVTDSKSLGESAMSEVAAAHRRSGEAVLTASRLDSSAKTIGFEMRPGDVVLLKSGTPLPRTGAVPAWQLGAEAAQALRTQERLGAEIIKNDRLAQMAGVAASAIEERRSAPPFAYALDESQVAGHTVLTSKWTVGRRFEVARLLGDRLLTKDRGLLFPATTASTYRQKAQRSFAAELLCPFTALVELLHGDHSPEALDDAAAHFSVSNQVVSTLLVNHGCIDREDLAGEIEVTSAA